MWYSISATRERVPGPGEVIPDSAEQSKTRDDNEEKYGAGRAIDLDLSTFSSTKRGSDGTSWLKVKLAKTHCIKQVIWYAGNGARYLTWTCSNTDCTTCEGSSSDCRYYTLTVSSQKTLADDLPLHSDCRYGDTVILRRPDGTGFTVRELGITAKQGEMLGTSVWDIVLNLRVTACVHVA